MGHRHFTHAKIFNKPYRVFVCINVCTRFVSAEPIKSGSKEELIMGVKHMTETTEMKPYTIYSDQEPALSSVQFQEFPDKGCIKIIFTKSLHKVGLAEREIKYLKLNLWRQISQSLAKYIDQDKLNNWPKYLPSIYIYIYIYITKKKIIGQTSIS